MGTIRICAVVLSLLVGGWAHAQSNGRIVVGFAAGGALDIMSRVVADALSQPEPQGLGRTYISDNRAGAEGRLAVDAVRTAAPDGATLLFSPIASIAIYPHTQKDLPYDPMKAFVPIGIVGAYSPGFAVGPMTPAKTLQEFIAWAKANPGKSSFGTPGNGNIPHFTGIMFARAAGIELQNVPYKGSVPGITDLIGGQIAAIVTTLGDFLTQARAGKLRVLAVAGPQRSSVAPDIPTFKELGYDIDGSGWYALFAPAGTPPALVDRINRIIMAAQQTPAGKARMEQLSLDIKLTTAKEFGDIVRADYERWGKIMGAAGFKAQ